MDWQALALSLRLATVTTAILLAIAVPLAALIVLGRGRWLAAVEALATLPMVLPPTVLGFFLLVMLAPPMAAARLLGRVPVRLVSSILIPLARRSLLAAIVLSFLHTIGEFGVVLML